MEARTTLRDASLTWRISKRRASSPSNPSGRGQLNLEKTLDTGLSVEACWREDNGAQWS